jgi:hypothetical protein
VHVLSARVVFQAVPTLDASEAIGLMQRARRHFDTLRERRLPILGGS